MAALVLGKRYHPCQAAAHAIHHLGDNRQVELLFSAMM
jgi:hypothetical protein